MLHEALRDAGFDLNAILWGGKRVEMSKRHNQNRRATVRGGVTGTLDIVVQREILDAERGQIKKHLGFIMKRLKAVTKEKLVETGSGARAGESKGTHESSIRRSVTLKPLPIATF